MRYESYIAPLDSPGFYWDDIPDEAYRSGNTPRICLAPSADFVSLGYSPYFVEKHIEAGNFVGQQIDWGAWAMIVTKADCLRLWLEQEPQSENRRDVWAGILADIEALDDSESYLLVVREMP